MTKKLLLILLALTALVGGCATVAEKTNMLSNEDVLSQTSGVLGYSPSELAIINRRTVGSNTYVNLIGKKDRRKFTCVINGGDLLSFGMANPPMCAKTGQPINTNSSARSSGFGLPLTLLMGR